MHERRAESSMNLRLHKTGQERLRRIERRHQHSGLTQFSRRVRVTSSEHELAMFLGDSPRAIVIGRPHTPRVEHFQRVHQVHDGQQPPSPHRLAAQAVAGMAHAHHAPLPSHACNRLAHGQARRNKFFQEKSNDLTAVRLDLFADDDELGRDLLCGQGARDGIVIGDGDTVNALASARGHELRRPNQAIRGITRVRVKLDRPAAQILAPLFHDPISIKFPSGSAIMDERIPHGSLRGA